jgi:hypothetical protein
MYHARQTTKIMPRIYDPKNRTKYVEMLKMWAVPTY